MNRSTLAAIVAAILIAPIMLALPFTPQATSMKFEVASIKPYKDAATAGGVVMIGGGCRGIDAPAPGSGGGPGGGGGGATQMTIAVGGPGGGGGGAGAAPNLPPGARGFGPPQIPIGRCVYTRMTVKQLLNAAYRLTALGGSIDQLLTGGPGWISTDQFDVEAKAEDPTKATQDQLREMLGNLVVDHFKLKLHKEKKEVQGFDLLLGKTGLKMKEASGDARPGGMAMNMNTVGGPVTMSSDGATMATILSFLSSRLGRMVSDKTGLNGRYNFKLTWTPGEGESAGLGGAGAQILLGPGGGAPAAAEPGISLFTALQEQMGLRLEASKVTIDSMVIDGAEKPANQ